MKFILKELLSAADISNYTKKRNIEHILNLDEMHSALRKQNSITAGQDGEKYASEWLEKSKWKFECVEQGTNTLSANLKSYGGNAQISLLTLITPLIFF